MTSIRAWNGENWVQPKYYVGTDPGPFGWPWRRWEAYTDPPYTPPPVNFTVSVEEAHINQGVGSVYDWAAWGFDADSQGWTTSYDPIRWRPGAIDLVPRDQYGNTDYIYSPTPDVPYASPASGWLIVSMSAWDPNSCYSPTIRGYLYYDGLQSHSLSHTFTYIGEMVRIDLTQTGFCDGFDVPHWQITATGSPKPSGAPQTIFPQYWDGAAWVTQNQT